MKKFFLTLSLGIFCLSLFTVSCGQSGSSKNSKEAEVTFVTTIDCGGCQKKVETNLSAAPGIKDFKVNLETKEVWVKYETNKINEATLIETIGYKATKK